MSGITPLLLRKLVIVKLSLSVDPYHHGIRFFYRFAAFGHDSLPFEFPICHNKEGHQSRGALQDLITATPHDYKRFPVPCLLP